MRGLLIACLTLGLLGCSSDNDSAGSRNATLRLVWDKLGALVGQGPAPAPFTVTRAAIADYPKPLIVVTHDGTKAGLVPTVVNGPWAGWATLDGISFTLRQGVLTATRGFGPDLLAAEAAQSVALITARQNGVAMRAHRRLDGENNILVTEYRCQIRNIGSETIVIFERNHRVTRVDEHCTGTQNAQSFTNTYWVGADGWIWQSDQWITAEAGRVFLEQLIK